MAKPLGHSRWPLPALLCREPSCQRWLQGRRQEAGSTWARSCSLPAPMGHLWGPTEMEKVHELGLPGVLT